MAWFISVYGIQIIVFLILLFGSWFIWDRRFKMTDNNEIPPGFKRTNEISIDPTTNVKQIVYYNKETGERIYIAEKNE